MQQLDLKFKPDCLLDYRTILLSLLKSFLRSHLEELMDKEATERSDAGRDAFLAELALDAKKNANQGGDKNYPMRSLKTGRKRILEGLRISRIRAGVIGTLFVRTVWMRRH